MVKVFSVEEANKLLPKVSEMLGRVFELNEQVSSLTADIKLLFDIWGNSVVQDPRNMDHELYLKKVRSREQVAQTLKGHIEEISRVGAVVKDVRTGLVDFYHQRDGATVFLCWKHGEAKIGHWHGVTEGYQARKPLELLDVRKHFA